MDDLERETKHAAADIGMGDGEIAGRQPRRLAVTLEHVRHLRNAAERLADLSEFVFGLRRFDVETVGAGVQVALGASEGLVQSLLRAHEEEWRNGKVYCNVRDADTVRSIVGKNFGGTIECVGGVVIESADGSRRIDLRFETILADIWRDSIKEVAEVLWPPQ